MIERIVVDPEVHFGKPCVAGTRITVQSVLELLDGDLSFDAIIQDYYPDLTPEDIRACVQYAIALVAIVRPIQYLGSLKDLTVPGRTKCAN